MDETPTPPTPNEIRAAVEADLLDAKARLEASILHCRGVLAEMLTRYNSEVDKRKPEAHTFLVGIHLGLATMDATRCVLLSPHPAVFLYMMMRPFAERAVQLRWVSLTPNGNDRFLARWHRENEDWVKKGEKHIGPTKAFQAAKQWETIQLPPGEKEMPEVLTSVIEDIHNALRARGMSIAEGAHQMEYRLTFGEWHAGSHAHHGIVTHYLLADNGANFIRDQRKTLFQLPCLWLMEAVCEFMGWDVAPYRDTLKAFQA